MTTYTPPRVDRFLVFNPTFGPKEENEKDKIIYYYPEETDINDQLKDVGLSEALTNVTLNFTDTPCEIMRTDKSRWVFSNPEEKYWLVLIINNGFIKNKSNEIEYLENTLNDMALKTLLNKIYMNYKLFNGSFNHVRQRTQSLEAFKEYVSNYFSHFLQDFNVLDVNIFGTLNGLQFLPVNKNIYLQIQSSVNSLEMTFCQIKSTILMYKDYLVWSGLEQNDTNLIYKYWIENFSSKMKSIKNERFIIGPEDLNDPNTQINLKDVYTSENCEHSKLAIYYGNGFIFFFFIDPEYSSDLKFFIDLHQSTSLNIETLSESIQHQSRSNHDEEFNYIYFNHMNLALKATIKASDIGSDVMSILQQLHQDFETSRENINEILIKPHGDLWIIGKKSDSRNLYILIEKKNSNILSINEDVKRLCKTQFQNIFMD